MEGDRIPTVQPRRIKWYLRWAGALFGLAATYYFALFVHRAIVAGHFETLLTRRMAGATALVALGCTLVIPFTSWAWGRLLRDTGVTAPALKLNMILGMTQIAKYIPGNIGHHLGRSVMSVQQGIQAIPLLITLVVEAVLTTFSGIIVSILALSFAAPLPWADAPDHWTTRLLAGSCLVVALAVCAAMIRNSPSLTRRMARILGAETALEVPRWGAISAATAAYTLNYLVIGVGLYALAFAAGDVSASAVPLCIGAFAASWVAGFVVPGAPAGIGVREGVMTAILAAALDPATTLSTVVALRVATTLGDVLGFLWGSAIFLARPGRRAASTKGSKHEQADMT